MKFSRADTRRKVKKIPDLRFSEKGRMTLFGGLVMFEALFRSLDLKRKLISCFSQQCPR